MTTFHIAVLAGDGIGPEVVAPALDLLDAACRAVGGLTLRYTPLAAGAAVYRAEGVAISEAAVAAAEAADAILLGAMGLPEVRYPDGREIAPQVDLRERWQLFAGVRPVRAIPGAPLPLADPRAAQMDFVLVREQTEGLFAARGRTEVSETEARDVQVITRAASERLFDFCFRLAERRKAQGHPGVLTCVDKANVLGSMVFFRKIFDERAARFPDVAARHRYVDAAALDLVKQPWVFDVMATENMYGDILSDLAAGLMGGLGMAPSADIGAERAVFQPCHGSAPDIAGQGRANPTATFLSAALMLDWLAERHGETRAAAAARRIERAVDAAYAGGGLRPCEFGGSDGTAAVTRRVLAALKEQA
ncbi:MAG: isocitrate/isopropylmalate dehydrogenase family protein [Kiloniellaceae bacterium]